ncbi:MAG: signal peptide protein [Chthoniobacteraceae bacterium]|nr:signal peptide protein [Chthoniobacteraceae bacterium]
MKRALLFLLLLALPSASHAEPLPKNWRAKHWRDIAPCTYNLPDPDVVELHLFEPPPPGPNAGRDPLKTKIIDTRRFTGAEARRIAQLWRDQDWVGFGASCHDPAYGITFYRDGRKLFFCSICFSCSNIYIYGAQSDTAGFNHEDRAYKPLRKIFKDIWGK